MSTLYSAFILIKQENPYFREGIVLDHHFVHTKCSPSRAALLTGQYAWKMGRYRGAILRFQEEGWVKNTCRREGAPGGLQKINFENKVKIVMAVLFVYIFCISSDRGF
jgi:hypothetical protein